MNSNAQNIKHYTGRLIIISPYAVPIEILVFCRSLWAFISSRKKVKESQQWNSSFSESHLALWTTFLLASLCVCIQCNL